MEEVGGGEREEDTDRNSSVMHLADLNSMHLCLCNDHSPERLAHGYARRLGTAHFHSTHMQTFLAKT